MKDAAFLCRTLRAICFGLILTAKSEASSIEIAAPKSPSMGSFVTLLAADKNWWSDASVGLAVPSFHRYASGSQSLSALPGNGWQVGLLNPIAAALGGMRNKGEGRVVVVGLTSLDLLAHSLETARWPPDDFSNAAIRLPTETIFYTPASTGEYLLRGCLARYGLDLDALNQSAMEQALIVASVRRKEANVAEVWSPNTNILENRENARPICTGGVLDFALGTVLVARADVLERDPTLVAKLLAINLRVWGWIGGNREKAAEMLVKYLKESGIKITKEEAYQELLARAPPKLSAQRRAFAAPNGIEHKMFADLAAFMVRSGTIQNVPSTTDILDSRVLDALDSDINLAGLRAFATEFD